MLPDKYYPILGRGGCPVRQNRREQSHHHQNDMVDLQDQVKENETEEIETEFDL